jgi:hypothetical protein
MQWVCFYHEDFTLNSSGSGRNRKRPFVKEDNITLFTKLAVRTSSLFHGKSVNIRASGQYPANKLVASPT